MVDVGEDDGEVRGAIAVDIAFNFVTGGVEAEFAGASGAACR